MPIARRCLDVRRQRAPHTQVYAVTKCAKDFACRCALPARPKGAVGRDSRPMSTRRKLAAHATFQVTHDLERTEWRIGNIIYVRAE